MISTAIIVFGVCLVVIALINAIKSFAIDANRRAHKTAAMALWAAIIKFQDEFNSTYSNTEINFYVNDDGMPVIEADDVYADVNDEEVE